MGGFRNPRRLFVAKKGQSPKGSGLKAETAAIHLNMTFFVRWLSPRIRLLLLELNKCYDEIELCI